MMIERTASDSTRRVWRRSTDAREPLLVTSAALDVEYEDPAVHREPSGEAGVIVVDIHGPLEHHEHPYFASYENVSRIVCAVLDRSDVRAVVMRIDSPGGVANGMSQASQAIRLHADRSGKPLYVYVDEQACSAAYGLACAADEIWGPPTAEVGSVGVILPVCDVTAANEAAGVRVDLITTGARKGDGDPNKPLTDDVRAALQARVDAIGEDFFALVSARRGMSTDDVRALEAGVFVGPAAVDAGLLDGVASFAEFLAIVKASVTERPEGAETGDREMAKSSRLALVKAHQEAEAVLRAATTPDAIAQATVKLAEAAKALEGASAGARYYKETTKIEERVEEDSEDKDDDEPESERGEDDDEAPPSSKPQEAVEDAEEEAEEESEEDGEEEAEDAEKMEKSSKSSKSSKAKGESESEDREVPKKYPGASAGARSSVLGHVRALTGTKDRATMLGKLDALAEKAARYDAIVAKRAQADQGKRSEALITEAIRAGKVGPKNAKLLEQLRAMEPKRLAAFLDSMPVLVRREPTPAAVAPDGGVTKVDTLSKQAREVIAAVARTTGKSIEQATAEYVDAYTRAAGR